MRDLPLFLTRETKLFWGLSLYAVAGSAYLLTNHFPLRPPIELPMTSLDNWVPFLPYTLWIYLSEYLFFLVVYYHIENLDTANKYLYALAALSAISALIFIVFPTTYPRHLFPLPGDLDPFTAFSFRILRESDNPTNCSPSLHVSSVFLSAFLFINEQKKKLANFLFWGVLIALSTLTTKQHYLADVVSGIALSLAVYLYFFKIARYSRVE